MRKLPRPLKTGDKIAIVCPSSAAPEEDFLRGIACVEDLGFVPVIGRSCEGRRAYLAAASDEAKADDLHRAFCNDDIAGILCARGGSGAGRILSMLDARAIAPHPKIFAGYSDITALHAFLAKRCNMLTFHAPMATSKNLAEETSPTRAAFIRALTCGEPLGVLCDTLTAITAGVAKGELVGGNLALLCTTLGTRWEIETSGKILFIEDVDEEPYSIDRMLAHLRNANKFDGLAGVVLGDFTDCAARNPENERERVDIFVEYFSRLGVPVAFGLPSGHGAENLTFPLGATATLDAAGGALSFEERHFA